MVYGVGFAILCPIYRQCLGVSSAFSNAAIPTPTLCSISIFYKLDPVVRNYSLSYILTRSAISQILDTYLSSISWPRPPAILRIRSFRELLPRMSTWSPVFGPPRGENLSGSCGISYVVIGILAGLYRVMFRQPFEHTKAVESRFTVPSPSPKITPELTSPLFVENDVSIVVLMLGEKGLWLSL